jgi:bifunctional UDP-N-acetylglucosamine pyrophosphorylase/glucosamine-1-phosphate N-acetyltransferase/UDP-N-acetylglucosamine pyrophosphorylase
MDDPIAVILAAGKGTRMKIDRAKVLVEVLGRSMIHFVLDAVFAAGIRRAIVVVGYQADEVRRELAGRNNVAFADQTEQKGTGHAVMMCADQLGGHTGPVMVLAGDSPLAQSTSLAKLLSIFQRQQPACLLGTLHKENPTGLGRIVRDPSGHFMGIVEEKDATDQQRRITEVNMSTYLFNGPDLLATLPLLRDNNRQGEYYLTDSPGVLRAQGKKVLAEPILQPCEALSINNFEELRLVEAELRRMGYQP